MVITNLIFIILLIQLSQMQILLTPRYLIDDKYPFILNHSNNNYYYVITSNNSLKINKKIDISSLKIIILIIQMKLFIVLMYTKITIYFIFKNFIQLNLIVIINLSPYLNILMIPILKIILEV